jgi:hypothetical protein
MTKENKGNVSEDTPQVDLSQHEDTIDAVIEQDSDSFFSALDESVNSVVMGNESKNVVSKGSNEPQEQPEQNVDYQQEAENLSKRYADSSREAKRLNNRIGEIEPYMPILDAMRQDPNLVSHVKNYFEGGGSTPASMKEQLGLSEDFVFDADEAFGDNNSESSKVMSAAIDGVVQRRLSEANANMADQNRKLNEEASFKQKHNMSPEEWDSFQSFAKGKRLELDDIYFLMNRKDRDKKIAENAGKQVSQQMKQVQNRPGSIASSGSQIQEQSVDDKVFDMLKGVDENWNALSGD